MNKTLHSLELSISFNFHAGKPDFARCLAFASKFGTSLQGRENSEMGYSADTHVTDRAQKRLDMLESTTVEPRYNEVSRYRKKCSL